MDALFSVFLFLVKSSLTAGIITAVLLIIRLLIRKKLPRKISYALWGLVLLRLAVPISLPSPTSIFTHTGYTPQQSVIQDFPNAVQPEVDFPPAVTTEPESRPVTQPDSETTAPPPQTPASQPQTSTPSSTAPNTPSQTERVPLWEQPLPYVAASVWFCGMIVLLLSSAGVYLLLRQKYKTACLYEDQTLFECCNRMLRHPFRRPIPLYTSVHAASPLVIGIFRPRIILPEGEIPEDQAICMVLHELIHIRRGDPFIRLLSIVLACVHWFNPMIWLALKFSAKDMELSCDEAALSLMEDGASTAYATALLDLSVRQHRGLSPLLMFGESNLKSRVKNVLSYKKPTLWVSIAAVLILAICAAVLLTDPVREFSPDVGDQLAVDMDGVSLSVRADSEIIALLDAGDWQELEEEAEMDSYPTLEISAGQETLTFSQADPIVRVTNEGKQKSFLVPLGTEETLRDLLLKNSEEYQALPNEQQQILTALLCSETVWGMRDYADYFPINADFISRLSAAILSVPGEVTSGLESDWERPAQYITINLVNPQGASQVHLWKQDDIVCLNMGDYDSTERQIKLDTTPFEELFEEFEEIPYVGWSTDQIDITAPGYTVIHELPASYSVYPAGDWLVCYGFTGGMDPYELQILDSSTGELLYSEPAISMQIKQIRLSETNLYDLEITGYTDDQMAFVWGIKLGETPLSNYYLNWPESHMPEGTYYSTDIHLTDQGVIAALYNGYSLQVTEDIPSGEGESTQIVLGSDQIHAEISESGMFIGDYTGLDNIILTNNGKTIVADITMADYPFANGIVLAAREDENWNTRILPGNPYYAESGLYNSFNKVLADGTIAYYQLDQTGWTVELIDPDTLETIRTLNFGGYSYQYLSLEGKYPLSISGDSFYSPRVIVRLLNRTTAAVIDRSYKLGGQRLYLLDFSQNLLSEPVMLNGMFRCMTENWIITSSSTVVADELQPQTIFSSPITRLQDTLGSRELRPVLAREERIPAQPEEVLLTLFNQPCYLYSREGNFSGYSDALYTSAFHPLRWKPCEQPPELPAKPTVTAQSFPMVDTEIASLNLYETTNPVILELLPKDESAAPLYYTADPNYPDSVGTLVSALETYGNPRYYPEYITGRDADLEIFQSEYQMDILDAAAILQTGHRLRYDNRMVSVLSMQGNTAICLISRASDASYAEKVAEPGLIPEGVRQSEIGGYTFYESENHALIVFTAGETPSAVSLADGYAQGMVSTQMLAQAQAAAAEEMPRLYRDETTFRIEQILNFARWTNAETGNPAAMFNNQSYYRFAEWMADYQNSDEWEDWQQKLTGFLQSHEEYAEFLDNMPEALHVFYPGEVFREVIRDAWGEAAMPDWENTANLLQYYPEEDIVATAYGIGFESSSHYYPISLEETDGKLTVSYATLYFYPGDQNPFVSASQNGEDQYWLGESWPATPTLAELQQRADELPLQTAVFRKENGRWIFDSPLAQ